MRNIGVDSTIQTLRRRVARWSKSPGRLVTQRKSVATGRDGRESRQQPSRIAVGRHSPAVSTLPPLDR